MYFSELFAKKYRAVTKNECTVHFSLPDSGMEIINMQKSFVENQNRMINNELRAILEINPTQT